MSTTIIAPFEDAADWERAFYAFLAEKERRSGSRRTVEGYSRMLQHFLGVLGKPPDQVTSQEVFAWAYGKGLSGKEPSPVTIGARLACLSSFYRFLIRMEIVASNPCDQMERPRTSPSPPRGLSAEETRQYGKLPVLLARMNPDLAMGDELLKKTGAGNLFMVFGEPDVDVRRQDDGKLVVEIKGVDVYDPTTGQIRSSTTDDIACWFIDTDYNEESFFVRHAYFTGAEEPHDKLKRALRAEVDEAAWASLYSTRSYPFDPPSTGKIAIKVINHYGDEVLKVYEV